MRLRVPRARVFKVGAAGASALRARKLPAFVRWSIRLGTLRAQVAWFLAVVGLLLCLGVLPRITGYPHYVQRASAFIIDSDGIDAIYQYADRARIDHIGRAPLHGSPHIGEMIEIWYDPDDPGRSSTIEEYEPEHPGTGAYALLVWPGVAILLAGLFMWRPRVMRLLRHGQHTSVHPVRTDADPFVITFDYVTDTGERKTSQIPALRAYREPDKLVLMYAPWNPDFAMVLDELPTRPRLDGDRFVATVRSLGFYVLPAATLAAGVLLALACMR